MLNFQHHFASKFSKKITFYLFLMKKYEIYLKLKVVLNVKVDGYIALGFYLLELAYSPPPPLSYPRMFLPV